MDEIVFDVPSGADQAVRLLRLVAAHAGVAAPLRFDASKEGAEVGFTAPDGSRAFGLHTAARRLAAAAPAPGAAARLLGGDAAEAARVAEWLAFAGTRLSPLMDDALLQLDAWLRPRTFVTGSAAPTLADLAVYAAVAPAAAAFPEAQHGHFAALLRWYDHIHATVDVDGLFPAAVFAKPPLRPLPPAEPPARAPRGGAAAAGAPEAAAAPPPQQQGGKKAAKAAAAAAAAAAGAPPPTPAASAEAPPPKADKKDKKDKKKDASPATAPAAAAAADAAAAAAAAPDEGPRVDVLDLRVGRILSVERHPNADSLYVEQIDLGEPSGPRQIVSGLVKHCTEAELAGRAVVVVANLKPAKMRDVVSAGMVLCASTEGDGAKVVPVAPPEGVPLGERVAFEGYAADPEPVLVPKKRQFEKVAPFLVTDAEGVCTWKGIPFMTSKGPVLGGLPHAHIK